MSKKFLLLASLLIVTRMYDFIATYLYTPVLSNETNILVRLFELNYAKIAVIQFFLLLLVILCLKFYIKNNNNNNIINGNIKIQNIKDFITYFHFGQKLNMLAFLYKVPKLKPIIYLIGYVATYSLIIFSFIVGTSTIFLIKSNYYKTIYKSFGPYALYTILLITVIVITIKFYKSEFLKYKTLSNSNK